MGIEDWAQSPSPLLLKLLKKNLKNNNILYTIKYYFIKFN